MKTCIMNTLIVIESLTIVNLLNKVQFPFVKVFPPQMLSSSSEGAIVQAVPIAFAPVLFLIPKIKNKIELKSPICKHHTAPLAQKQ